MPYLMMTIKNWECEDAPSPQDVCVQFNLVTGDIDEGFGVISLSTTQNEFVVMASVEAAKKMLAQHVDNTVAGHGPFVEGPFSSPGIGPGPEPYDDGPDRNCWDPRTWGPK